MARGTKRRAARPLGAGLQTLHQCFSKSKPLGSDHEPFLLFCGETFIPESVMDLIWACCSIPDLLTLIPASHASARSAQRRLLTLARLVELWGGCPSVQAVLYESSGCRRASATLADADQQSILGPGCATAGVFGKRAARILAEGVQWVLRARLQLPKNHLLLRFFNPGLKTDFCVCDVRKTTGPADVDHYSFRVHSLDCSQDGGLHVSVCNLPSCPREQQQGWRPDRASQLLGSMPWRVADALELRDGSLFAKGDRVKLKRPLQGSKASPSDPMSQGTVVGRSFGGLYHVNFDGDLPTEWHEYQLMNATEPFLDPLFKAMEERDAQALGYALANHTQGDLKEPLMYAVEMAFEEGVEQFPLRVLVELRDLLEVRHEALRRVVDQAHVGVQTGPMQVVWRAPSP